MADEPNKQTRHELLRTGLRGAALLGLGGAAGAAAALGRARAGNTVWQIDPYTCIACGKCAVNCVLEISAVKCVHAYPLCGYCELCTAYFEPQPNALNTGAENQLCPTGAIRRKFVEDPYYEYQVDEPKCVACGKCVKGCTTFGNGSMFLQIRHDRCVNCNECAIGRACPVQAIRRVPADAPYLLKTKRHAE